MVRNPSFDFRLLLPALTVSAVAFAHPEPPKPRTPPPSAPSASHASAHGAAGSGAPLRPGVAGRSGYGPGAAGARAAGAGAKGNTEFHRAASANVSVAHGPHGASVIHNSAGVRSFATRRVDGAVVVAHGNLGYVQKPATIGGHPFLQRTFIRDGMVSARIYRPWTFGGREYAFYLRERYYQPAYYLWVCDPYPQPCPYVWGWDVQPWYGYYGAYFRPYRVYEGPAFWLTDFVVAETLEGAYQAAPSLNARGGLFQPMCYTASLGHARFLPALCSLGPTLPEGTEAMPPQAKQALVDAVKLEMAWASDEARKADPGAVPAIFSDDGPRTFLVHAAVAAVDAGNEDCVLVEGDIITVLAKPAAEDEFTRVRVRASLDPGLPNGQVVKVLTSDLVEMDNALAASLDLGLEKLQNRTRGGTKADAMPVPPESLRGSTEAPHAKEVKVDPEAVAQFTQAVKEADQAEKDAQAKEAQAEAAELAALVRTVKVGMTLNQMWAILGDPDSLDNKAKDASQVYHYGKSTVKVRAGHVTLVAAKE
jgi:hypothetical protein